MSRGLPLPDVHKRIDALVDADWTRLKLFARFATLGLAPIQPNDLLHEALTALLAGQRVFPVDRQARTVVAFAMKSIASNLRKRAKTERTKAAMNIDPPTESGLGQPGSNPSEQVEYKELLRELGKSVEGDNDAELVLCAWAEGLRGEAARTETGLDEKQYDAARKRLVRRIAAVKEAGGKS